jgi:6-pyruvoyltetrahydropterin/6-carboxytetrahydropterin synthase
MKGGRFELSFATQFDAAHRLLDELYKSGTRLHGHTYPVVVTLRGSALLDHGMLLNHYSAREAIARAIGELHDTCLNDHPELGSVNTTPEVLAYFLWRQLSRELEGSGIEELAVEVGELPSQHARFDAPLDHQGPAPTGLAG